MKIYGTGVFKQRGGRVVWNFDDGPFTTFNSVLIQEAVKQGFSLKPLESKAVVKAETQNIKAAIEPRVKRKYTKKVKP